MSGSRRNTAVVSREYRLEPDYCTSAIELLLKPVKSKEGSPILAAPDSLKGGSSDSRARDIIPDRP